MILRAISVRQPWAWAIVQGLKPWENRPRRFGHRGPLLIHAGKAFARGDYAIACAMIERLSWRRPPAEPELGGIVGSRATGRWPMIREELGLVLEIFEAV